MLEKAVEKNAKLKVQTELVGYDYDSAFPTLVANLSPVGLRGFVDSFVAAGGTAIGEAVQAALAPAAAKGRVRTVVLLTDGLPTVGITASEKIVAKSR